jgi:hypothetical protein
MRALRWGHELLQEMTQDQSLPEDVREQAWDLLVRYPMPEALAQHVSDGAGRLPKTWGAAMAEALELFDAAAFGGRGSAQTRRSLLFARRHYPNSSEIRLLVTIDLIGHLLAVEDSFGK